MARQHIGQVLVRAPRCPECKEEVCPHLLKEEPDGNLYEM